VKGKEKLLCKLTKSLYGLKQAPRQWYLEFIRFMSEQGYTRCHSNNCVYLKKENVGNYIILLLSVDDMFVVGSNMQEINVLKGKLENSFAMKDLDAAKQTLGMRITIVTNLVTPSMLSLTFQVLLAPPSCVIHPLARLPCIKRYKNQGIPYLKTIISIIACSWKSMDIIGYHFPTMALLLKCFTSILLHVLISFTTAANSCS